MPPRLPVAIISNSLTPYRVHLHGRIAREVPEVELWSVQTHDQSNAPWGRVAADEIRPVGFGPGEKSDDQAKPANALHEWRKGGRIICWLRERGVRAVVLGGYNDAGRLRVLRWCHARGVPLFLFGDSNVRGDHPRGPKGAVKRRVLPRILRRCSGVMPCGTLGMEYFARYGVPYDRMFLFPYEPDYEQLRAATDADAAAARTRFGVPPGRQLVVYSGRLVGIKRVDLLIDAFDRLAAERPEWDLLVVGGGPDRDALMARVGASWRGRVHWTGFLDDAAAMAALYRAGEVLVLPSDYEPWAVVVNEAVAAGLAVVASDAVGAAADLVRDGVNGRIFPAGDGAALTECLRDATAAGRTDTLRAAAPAVLADWVKRADPVEGLRRALRFAGVLAP